MRPTRAIARRWRTARSEGDEQGSLILVMLLIMFMSIVIITVTTTAFGQLDLSNGASSRNSSLQAALAGVQAAVGEIRAASTDNTYVDPSALPCSAVTGSTSGSITTTYSASIQYYEETTSGSTTEVSCLTGSGPQVASGDYLEQAVITSCAPSGTCPTNGTPGTNASWRRVVSTYTFETSNVNIPGGLIYDYGESDCLLAQKNGSTWQLYATTSCTAGNANYDEELFQYTSTWNLAIDLSDVEYCVVDPNVLAAPAVTLSPCSGNTTNSSYQWGINDSGDLQDVVSGGSGNPGSYLLDDPIGGQAPASGGSLTSAMTTVSSSSGGFSDDWSWEFSPTVGSGGAAPSAGSTFGPTDQLVNYEQFGLCMDVTNQSVSSTYLIDYDCKQFPDTTTYPTWNQRWCFDQISTNAGGIPEGLLYTPDGSTSCSGGTPYCAKSPLSPSNGTSNDSAWVVVTSSSCTLNQALSYYGTNSPLIWVDWGGNTTDSDYTYTYTDTDGYCLEADTANQQDPGGGATFATIEVASCNGAYAEKWNAPASLGESQVSNTHEGTGDSWTVGGS